MRRPVLMVLLSGLALLCAWPAVIRGDALLDDVRIVPLTRPFPVADAFAQPPRWQPAVHASMRAVAALSPRRLYTIGVPLQHALSFGLYLLSLWLLLRLVRARRPGDQVHPWHAFVLAVFALHPSLVEPFAHLSARGEAIALAALAGLALALEVGRPIAAVALTLLGMAASPVVAPAAAALALASALDRPTPRDRATAAVVSLVALLTAVVTFGAHPTVADLARWALRAPRAVGLATRALVVPTETALRLPQWELSFPLDAVNTALAALPFVAAVALWGRRARGAAVLVVGAALSVLPLTLRADTLAYGFDRYLAGAALLLAVAALRAPAPAWTVSLPPPTRRLLAWSGAGLVALLMFMSRQTATGFRSDAHELDAMTQMHPRDPSGHLRNAWFAVHTGDPVSARESIALTLRGPLTPMMARVARSVSVALRQR